ALWMDAWGMVDAPDGSWRSGIVVNGDDSGTSHHHKHEVRGWIGCQRCRLRAGSGYPQWLEADRIDDRDMFAACIGGVDMVEVLIESDLVRSMTDIDDAPTLFYQDVDDREGAAACHEEQVLIRVIRHARRLADVASFEGFDDRTSDRIDDHDLA